MNELDELVWAVARGVQYAAQVSRRFLASDANSGTWQEVSADHPKVKAATKQEPPAPVEDSDQYPEVTEAPGDNQGDEK